jgi:Protein of unknown function (DUF3800)
MKYNLFVDESCHLEHDNIPVMCIGYIKVPVKVYKELYGIFESIKEKHNTPVELKWNKFSKSRLPLYKDLVNFFFDNPLQFRCVLVKYKDRLNNSDFNQGSHDNFYYKMAYYLLRPNPIGLEYRIFIDIKDTKGKQKLLKLSEVFDNFHKGESPFVHFQHLRSHENIFFQLTDLFIGAVTYKTRVENGEFIPNNAKMEFINYLETRSGFSLNESTAPWETKFNIFDHQPKNQ